MCQQGETLKSRLTAALEKEMNALGKRRGLKPMAWRFGEMEGRLWLIGSVNPGLYEGRECVPIVEAWAGAFELVRRETDFGTLEFDGVVEEFEVTVWTVTDPAAFYVESGPRRAAAVGAAE